MSLVSFIVFALTMGFLSWFIVRNKTYDLSVVEGGVFISVG